MAIIREMVKKGTLVNSEKLLPIKRKKEENPRVNIHLELF